MQISDAALYAAGLALVEQNLLHLHEVDAFASQVWIECLHRKNIPFFS